MLSWIYIVGFIEATFGHSLGPGAVSRDCSADCVWALLGGCYFFFFTAKTSASVCTLYQRRRTDADVVLCRCIGDTMLPIKF